VVGPLISVRCSYDIVKRVVTVKQVRPSAVGATLRARSGLGMGMRAADARASAGTCAHGSRSRKEIDRDGLFSVSCRLISDLACSGLGADDAEEGHLVDALAPRGDEGRGTLRKAEGRGERPVILGSPNGATHRACGSVR
jgi:hypothetical protein